MSEQLQAAATNSNAGKETQKRPPRFRFYTIMIENNPRKPYMKSLENKQP